MKKKLYLFAFMLWFFGSVNAQTIIFEDNFEAGVFGAEWTPRPNLDGGQNGIVDIFTNTSGASWVRLGKSSDAGGFTTNALDLLLDLEIETCYSIADFYDESYFDI